jgi:hypothetical protein
VIFIGVRHAGQVIGHPADIDAATAVAYAVRCARGVAEPHPASSAVHDAHRSGVEAWVVAVPGDATVEIWLRELCPHHDPPPSGAGCPEPDGLHDVPHQVPGCDCWCSGLSAAVMRPAAIVPAVTQLVAAAQALRSQQPEPGLTAMQRVCAWLRAATRCGDGGFVVFAVLVAEGVSAPRALLAASRIG